jgi:hypothetical protein
MTQKTPLIFLLTLTATLTFTACENKSGGHKSGGLPITKENQIQVTAALFDSIDTTTPMLPKRKTTDKSVTTGDTLIKLPDTASSNPSEPVEGTTLCSDGGSVTYRSDTATYTYDQCQEANTTVTGTVKESIDTTNGKATYELTNYSLSTGIKTYQTSHTTYTIENGTVSYTTTGKATLNDKTYEFSDYTYTLTLTGDQLGISVNGNLKTSDLKEWMSISTAKTIRLNDETCPVAGEVTVNGNALKVSFAEDKSIDIFLNNTLTQEYKNCDAIPTFGG